MTPFTVYDNTGRILRSGICQAQCLALQAGEGQSALPLPSNDETDYVSEGAVLPRPTMQLEVSNGPVPADGVTEAVITGVPAGASVTVTGPADARGEAIGEPVQLTFSLAGAYMVRFELFPYQDAKVTIHAT